MLTQTLWRCVYLLSWKSTMMPHVCICIFKSSQSLLPFPSIWSACAGSWARTHTYTNTGILINIISAGAHSIFFGDLPWIKVHNMAASEENSALFPIFILTIMALPLVPYTIHRLFHAASKKTKSIHCPCAVCLRSGKYRKSIFKRVSFTSNSLFGFASFYYCVFFWLSYSFGFLFRYQTSQRIAT